MGTRIYRKPLIPLFILLVCMGVDSGAQKISLLALSKNDHILAIVDPVTYQVIAKVPVGPDPHEVIASADGKTAYVSNTGGGQSTEINVIDLVAKKPLPNIDTRPLVGPHGLTFSDGKLWFSAEGTKSVGRYDPKSNKVDWSMGTGQERTHMVFVTPDAKKIYTTNVNAGTVSLLEYTQMAPGPGGPMGGPPPPPGGQPRKDWVHTVIPVSKGSEGFDVTPDGLEVWTAAADDGTIAIIDLKTRRVSTTIDAKVIGANRLKFTPDGKQVLVSSLRTGDLFVFDAVSHKLLKKISTGHGGAGILITEDGSKAFIGCTPDNYVAVVDLKKMELVARITIGGGPDGLAWAIQQ